MSDFSSKYIAIHATGPSGECVPLALRHSDAATSDYVRQFVEQDRLQTEANKSRQRMKLPMVEVDRIVAAKYGEDGHGVSSKTWRYESGQLINTNGGHRLGAKLNRKPPRKRS